MHMFKDNFESFLAEFSKGKTMVLSSSLNDKVSARCES